MQAVPSGVKEEPREREREGERVRVRVALPLKLQLTYGNYDRRPGFLLSRGRKLFADEFADHLATMLRRERESRARSLSIKSLKRFCCDGTMDKTRIRDDEWRRCHLQRAMMHSHGRCIKAVYAREERSIHFHGRSRRSSTRNRDG